MSTLNFFEALLRPEYRGRLRSDILYVHTPDVIRRPRCEVCLYILTLNVTKNPSKRRITPSAPGTKTSRSSEFLISNSSHIADTVVRSIELRAGRKVVLDDEGLLPHIIGK